MLSTMCNETVTIYHRRTGEQTTNVKAMVQPQIIFVPNDKVSIEPDDVIERVLPSGTVERFVVTEPGFYARTDGIEGHYQVKFYREGSRPRLTPRHSIHVSGGNVRVNVDSIDHSTNLSSVQAGSTSELLSELQVLRRELLTRAGDKPENFVAIGTVVAAEGAAAQGDETKAGLLLGTLGTASDWVLSVAKDLSVKIAAEMIKSHMGS